MTTLPIPSMVMDSSEMETLKANLEKLEADMTHMRHQGDLAQIKVRDLGKQLADTMKNVEISLNLVDKKKGKDLYETDVHYQKIYYWWTVCGFSGWRSGDCTEHPKRCYQPVEIKGTLQEQEEILSDRLVASFDDWLTKKAIIDDQESKIAIVQEKISQLKKSMRNKLATFRSKYPWHK